MAEDPCWVIWWEDNLGGTKGKEFPTFMQLLRFIQDNKPLFRSVLGVDSPDEKPREKVKQEMENVKPVEDAVIRFSLLELD
jgi:hypothetical protein